MQGAAPPHWNLSQSQSSVGVLGGIIGNRKRAVGDLSPTAPFFGAADGPPRWSMSRDDGQRPSSGSGPSAAREHKERPLTCDKPERKGKRKLERYKREGAGGNAPPIIRLALIIDTE